MICHRCGATVPEELPICGSCGQDLTIPRDSTSAQDTDPGDAFAGDTERHGEVSGLSGSLKLREAGMAGGQQGLPYTTGDLVVERYQIDDVIAEGPVGVLYSALDMEADVQIALKVILSEYFPDQAALERCDRVMARARQMSHPNIVRVYDTGPDDSRFLVAQRLVMGRTLSEILAGRLPQSIPSPSDEVHAIVTQIGEALAYAHPDVTHGAIKPTNVIILPSGLKLTDFCLATAISSDAYIAGHRHRRIPSRYLAPELLDGGSLDHRSDLYSLAVLGFELLTGVPLPQDPERREGAMADLPSEARQMLKAALSTSPGRRPDDVDDLVEALLTATCVDSRGVPDAAALAVGDSTNVLDLDDVEVIADDEDDPGQELLTGAADSYPTDPGPTHLPGAEDEIDTVVKRPSMDAWPAIRTPASSIPVAEPSTDQFRRVDPAHLGATQDPNGFIEAAEEIAAVPDIDLDGKPRPGQAFGLQPKGGSHARAAKVKDAIEEMDFEASLEEALASAARRPPPRQGPRRPLGPPKAARRRKRGPGHDPDPDAMRDRPVAAAGVTLAASQTSKLNLPAMDEPAVRVETQQVAVAAPDGTAQIPIPEEPPSGRSGVWIGLIIFALICAAITVGIIVFKRAQEDKASKELARRQARLRVLALRRGAMSLDAGHPAGPEAMALPIMSRPGSTTGPKIVRWRRGCPVSAVRVRDRRRRLDFCIDRYEHPGRRGVLPTKALDKEEAQRLCRAQGKRLCSLAEWRRACGGKRRRLYSYGDTFRRGVCATASPSGEKRPLTAAGSHPRCKSPEGVYDLNGNIAEWVSSSQLMGGSAGKPPNQTTCRSDAGAGGSAYYGVRCCATPRRR